MFGLVQINDRFSYAIWSKSANLFWKLVGGCGPGLKTEGVMGPKRSTDEGT